jgi:hypothetical protein
MSSSVIEDSMNSRLRTIHPVPPWPLPSFYGRLFRASAENCNESLLERLTGLADSMRQSTSQNYMPHSEMSIPAGYTYFGQFIDHDLSFEELVQLPDGSMYVPPETRLNHRQNFLKLDNLYGEGPAEGSPDRNLYQEDGLHFKLGATLSTGQCFDVPLDENCRPLVADPRNAENAIVRQIHAMFLLLHNKVAKHFGDFHRAQQWVRHQFQYLVLCDYLPKICNQTVLDAMKKRPNSLIDWSKGFAVPVEFARATFRFGHSMVRPEYHHLGEGDQPTKVCLSDLFGKSPGPLQTRLSVRWSRFLLEPPEISHELAMSIDTLIADPLFEIPAQTSAVFASPGRSKSKIDNQPNYEPRLPLRTLIRGAASRLATGQQAKDIACPEDSIKPIIYVDECGKKRDPRQYLCKYNFLEETPLWYYVLLEAQLNEVGSRLGTLGSMIVAGTIEGALWVDAHSYVHKCDLGLPPPLWEPRGGRTELRTLFDVARYVGLA